MKKIIILIFLVFIIGYLLRDNDIIYCVGSTFYVISYLTIAIYIIYLLVFFFLINIIYKKIRKRVIK